MAYRPHPHAPDALPLSGTDERMLRDGGHFTTRADLYLSKGKRPDLPPWMRQGLPRNPQQREGYDGTECEPDPNLSDARTTGRLIRRMLLKGWNRDQILDALLTRANKGGAWFRWQENTDDLLDRFIKGSTVPQRNGPISPGNSPISDHGKGPIPPPEEGSGFQILPGILDRLLTYAEEAPRSRTDLIKRGPIWHKGAAAAYVDHATEAGLIRWVQGLRTKPRGPVPLVAEVVRPAEDLAALVASWMES